MVLYGHVRPGAPRGSMRRIGAKVRGMAGRMGSYHRRLVLGVDAETAIATASAKKLVIVSPKGLAGFTPGLFPFRLRA